MRNSIFIIIVLFIIGCKNGPSQTDDKLVNARILFEQQNDELLSKLKENANDKKISLPQSITDHCTLERNKFLDEYLGSELANLYIQYEKKHRNKKNWLNKQKDLKLSHLQIYEIKKRDRGLSRECKSISVLSQNLAKTQQ